MSAADVTPEWIENQRGYAKSGLRLNPAHMLDLLDSWDALRAEVAALRSGEAGKERHNGYAINVGLLSVIEADFGVAPTISLAPNPPVGEFDLIAVPRGKAHMVLDLNVENESLRAELELTKRNLQLAWREATK